MEVTSGELFTGLGEGRKYISMDHYRNEIIDKAGFDPFPGTLNLYVDPEKLESIKEDRESARIEEDGDYIGMDVYPVEVAGIEAAYLDLDVTDHGEDVMELVAPVEIREELDLEDGDRVEVEWQTV